MGGGAANRPTLTGPGLSGPGFYDDAGACTRATQTIDFAPLAGRPPDAPDFDVSATASSGLPVTFAAAGECTITGTTVHVTGLGTCTITASQAGDGVWKPALRGADVRDPPAGRDGRRAAGAVQRLVPRHGLGDRRRLGGLGPDRGRDGAAGGPDARRRLDLGRRRRCRASGRGPCVGIATVAPGSYPVSVTVTNDEGGVATTEFAIVVAPENAEATYTGDTIVDSTGTLVLRAVVRDSPDGEPGDIRKATVTFTEAGAVVCGPVDVELLSAPSRGRVPRPAPRR